MKIKKVIINNFRAYKGEKLIEFDDLTVFVGKNDVGKSTILDALDIFFNEKDAITKLEKDDLNKQAEREGENEISIGVIFTNFPEEIVVDTTVKTSLKDEYLLNRDGFFEVHKIFKNGKPKPEITNIIANHPVNDEIVSNLILKKITELNNIVKDKELSCKDKRKASLLRKAIRDNYHNLKLEEKSISVDEEGTKQIWVQLEKYMPIYALFRSDRPNEDQDNLVQDPLKYAVKEILKSEDILNKLQEVARDVENASEKVAESTLEQLKGLNPEIAKKLKPKIPKASELKWYDVFKKISISSDDDIPLNKRGSGVRRLVLISFFGAEAERRKKEDTSNIIYAIEEPETSQHPEHQKYLVDSLIKLSEADNTQIILTTHHPTTAQLMPPNSLRLVKIDKEKLMICKNESILIEIADSLGILPTAGKVVICVEGERDRQFLLNINKIPELMDIINLENRQISIIPMNGANLKNWIDRNYLENSNVIEFHLYDKDSDEKYKSVIENVNERQDESYGTLTSKNEIENYIHKDIIIEFEKFKTIDFSKIQNWYECDIIEFITKNINMQSNDVKSIICGCLAKNMTKKLFQDLDAWNEVEGWFRKVKELFDKTIIS